MKMKTLKRKPASKAPAVKKKPAATSKTQHLGLSFLKRRYFALRHGESEANVAHKIISDPSVGIDQYGLTEHGKDMVVKSAAKFKAILKDRGINLSEVAVLASDFKRAAETALIFCQELGIDEGYGYGKVFSNSADLWRREKTPIKVWKDVHELLRERRFGRLEAGPDSRYNDVWKVDVTNPKATPFDSESCDSVRKRTVKAVQMLEELPKSLKLVVLVSHGDALQILQTAFEGISAGEHRSLRPLDRAELRELVPATKV